MRQKQSKPLVLCGPNGSPYRSRGVLQNARRVCRKAQLMQITDYRAFCKTPLLAAVGSQPLTQDKQKTEKKWTIVFVKMSFY